MTTRKDLLRLTRAARVLNTPQWWAERVQLVNSDGVSCPSRFAKSWLGKQVRMEERKLPVIPNGIDMAEFAPYRVTRSSAERGRKLVCFVGRCSVAKGASVLARAVPEILDHDPDADVLFAGPRVDEAIAIQLASLAKRYPGRVQIPGRLRRETLLPAFARACLLVQPTFYEISPMAVLEAMALGVPVAASRTGPLVEMVDEGETGLLFEPGDEHSLADGVLTLLGADRRRIEEMGNAAREKIEREFNFFALSQQVLNFYGDTIQERLTRT